MVAAFDAHAVVQRRRRRLFAVAVEGYGGVELVDLCGDFNGTGGFAAAKEVAVG